MKFKKAKIEFSKKKKTAEQSRNCEILENSWLKTVDEEGKSVFTLLK